MQHEIKNRVRSGPCDECPFRTDREAWRSLPAQLTKILNFAFDCHMSELMDGNLRVMQERSVTCAGAAIVLYGFPNRRGTPLFDSIDQIIARQIEAGGRAPNKRSEIRPRVQVPDHILEPWWEAQRTVQADGR